MSAGVFGCVPERCKKPERCKNCVTSRTISLSLRVAYVSLQCSCPRHLGALGSYAGPGEAVEGMVVVARSRGGMGFLGGGCPPQLDAAVSASCHGQVPAACQIKFSDTKKEWSYVRVFKDFLYVVDRTG